MLSVHAALCSLVHVFTDVCMEVYMVGFTIVLTVVFRQLYFTGNFSLFHVQKCSREGINENKNRTKIKC
jgi:hypothetical protein